MHRGSIRKFHGCAVSYAKKLHWAKEAVKKTHVDRAMEHFDDFYGSVYKDKWPSLRLGLLCAPKYMAIPNVFTGDERHIGEALENLGALNIADAWRQYNAKIEKELEALELRKTEDKVRRLESAMEDIAVTKVAEEMDALYQNAPRRKLLMEQFVSSQDQAESRLLKDIREASQEYVTETRLKGADDFVLESEYFTFYANQMMGRGGQSFAEIQFTGISNYKRLKFPPLLRPYAFEPGSAENFPSAGLHRLTGLREFICINGASVAPIIALDLIPGVSFLDLCSGPGTKSLLSYMTTCPDTMTCNDVDAGRLRRIHTLFKEFLGKDTPENINFTRCSGANYPDETKYSRILADVPCLSDRVSVTVPDNNIFKPTRTKERIGLVQVQKNILLSAFKCLLQETGSTVVYSTCTLSPVENDGAVSAALRETDVQGLHVDLLGLWTALKPLQEAGFFVMNRTKFGVLIEPSVISNFGPMFVSRIVYIQPEEELNSEV